VLFKSAVLYNTKQSYTPPLEPYEFNQSALIIDTETVGTGPHIEIVEIAIGDIDGNIVFNSLIQPVYNRLPRSTKLQRFDKGEFDQAPEWSAIWPNFQETISGKLLIAYNASFDRRAIAAMCARHRQASAERGWRCAMELARRTLGVRRALTLEDACGHFGLEGGTHRAVRDVEATICLIRRLTSDRANVTP
jgi:DNA polymerase III epsilon subunit-like protein